jgi:preprotein translocase subunit SecB
MMKETTPLLLETHFFTKVIVEANPGYDPGKSGEISGKIKTNVEVGQNKDDPRRWRVILILQAQSKDKIPYKIELNCVGFFKVGPEVEEGKMGHLVRANGAAILYSSAREFLLLITGRGPWDPFYLPTTNFLAPPKPKRSATTGAKQRKLGDSATIHQAKENQGKAK